MDKPTLGQVWEQLRWAADFALRAWPLVWSAWSAWRARRRRPPEGFIDGAGI
jgi:hypothetical protein